MPSLFVQKMWPRGCILLGALALVPAPSGCARRRFFPADARVGPGSEQALPAGADTVRAAAGRQYNRHSGLYCALLGRHYRRVWAAPVAVPVLRLARAAPGGLMPGKPGGGYQSISMTLDGADGREYALRALDKEPSKTLPLVLRATFALNAVRDATSAAIPYGALTVPALAQAAGVPHTRPRLVYVRPDETGLAGMSDRFRGKVALLEEKYVAPVARTPDLAGADGFLGGEAMLKHVYGNPAAAIDQLAFLRARLLDVWLGDWDRHEGQWQWAAFGGPGGRVRYRAIPKDRDQVYYRFDDGLVPWLAARPFIAPQFQTFKPRYGNVAGLVYQAKFIDERGLSQLTGPNFQRMAADLQHRLPDTLIDRALHCLPPAVFALEGARLAAALRARREALPRAAAAFYATLARAPVVGGTAQAERFEVRRYADSTTVRVFSAALGRHAPGDSLRFRRTYLRAETQLLTLEGLGGDDVFDVTTAPDGPPMALAVYGGAGRDRLRLRGGRQRLQLFDTADDLAAPGAPRPHPPGRKHRPYDRLNDD